MVSINEFSKHVSDWEPSGFLSFEELDVDNDFGDEMHPVHAKRLKSDYKSCASNILRHDDSIDLNVECDAPLSSIENDLLAEAADLEHSAIPVVVLNSNLEHNSAKTYSRSRQFLKTNFSILSKVGITKSRLIRATVACGCIVVVFGALQIERVREINAQIDAGRTSIIKGDGKTALRQLDKVIATSPSFASYFARAQAQNLVHAFDRQYADLKAALSFAPNHPTCLKLLGTLCLHLNRYKESVGYLQRYQVLEKENSEPQTSRDLAKALMMMGNYRDALSMFRVVQSFSSADPNLMLSEAICQRLLGHPDVAIEICSKLLNQTPQSTDALVLRAQSYEQQGKNVFASRDFDLAVSIEPKSVLAYLGRAEFYANTQRFPLALKDLEITQKFAPLNNTVHEQRATVFFLQKDYRGAESEYKLLANKPDYRPGLEFYAGRARLDLATKKYQEALADAKKAKILNDRGTDNYDLIIADSYNALNQNNTALEICNELISNRPGDLSALLKHAEFSYVAGNEITALDDYCKAVGTYPSDPRAYFCRGKYYLRQKQYNRALEDFERALKLDPSNLEAGTERKLCLDFIKRVRSQKPQYSETKFFTDDEERNVATFNPKELQLKGYQALKDGRTQYACLLLLRAVKLEPNAPVSRCYLAHALIKSGNLKDGIAQFYAWEKLATVTGGEELSFVKSLFENGGTTESKELVRRMIDKFSADPAVLLGTAQECKELNFNALGIMAVEAGAKKASPTQLVAFEELRKSLNHIEEKKEVLPLDPLGRS